MMRMVLWRVIQERGESQRDRRQWTVGEREAGGRGAAS